MLAKLLQNWVCRKVKLRGESDRIWGGGDWTRWVGEVLWNCTNMGRGKTTVGFYGVSAFF